MAHVPLSNGFAALVDDDVVPLLSGYRWLSLRGGRKTLKVYALAWVKGGGRSIYMHRLILGAERGQIVDHINGDTLDNRRANLRIATAKENAGNIRVTKRKSGYRGVQPSCPPGKWVARIGTGGVTIGRFNTPEEAAMAYDEAAKQRYGDFAVLNFPLSPIPS